MEKKLIIANEILMLVAMSFNFVAGFINKNLLNISIALLCGTNYFLLLTLELKNMQIEFKQDIIDILEGE